MLGFGSRPSSYFEELYQTGEAHYNQGDYHCAIQNFKKALQNISDRNPTNTFRAWYGLGSSYLQLNSFLQATQAYTQAIAANPNFHLTYFQRAICYARLNHFDNAILEYTQAIRLAKASQGGALNTAEFADYYAGRGAAYFCYAANAPQFTDQEVRHAIKDLEKALQLDPANALAQDYLPQAKRLAKQLDSAPALTTVRSTATTMPVTSTSQTTNWDPRFYNRPQTSMAPAPNPAAQAIIDQDPFLRILDKISRRL